MRRVCDDFGLGTSSLLANSPKNLAAGKFWAGPLHVHLPSGASVCEI